MEEMQSVLDKLPNTLHFLHRGKGRQEASSIHTGWRQFVLLSSLCHPCLQDTYSICISWSLAVVTTAIYPTVFPLCLNALAFNWNKDYNLHNVVWNRTLSKSGSALSLYWPLNGIFREEPQACITVLTPKWELRGKNITI